MAVQSLKRSFPPVVNEETRLVVLGSLPGEESLARRRYYANPRNQFWALMSSVIGADLVTLAYEERLAALLRAGIGLWDTVASATRSGSLDTAIRGHTANALKDLADMLPNLRAFAFNGAKAAAVGCKELGETPLQLIALPSSSPAYTLTLAAKQAQWMKLTALLERPSGAGQPDPLLRAIRSAP